MFTHNPKAQRKMSQISTSSSNAEPRTATRDRSSAPATSRGSTSRYGQRPSAGGRGSFGGSRGSSFGQGGGSRRFGGQRSSGRGGNRRGVGMDIMDFIHRASQPTPEIVTEITHDSFSQFGFDTRIDVALERRGYVTPSPIQDQAIPYALTGSDVIGLAATGTGKTAAFLLPLINKILNDNSQNVLVLAPTRELALQINAELREFTVGMRINSAVCVGGMSIHNQIRDLRRHPHFVIGTPGRVQDLVNRGELPLRVFQNVVLDEADHMVDMGFYEPIVEIMKNLPAERQTLFFSATMPPRIRTLTSQFLTHPVTIEISSGRTTHLVEQELVRTTDRAHKMELLHEMLISDEFEKVIIFNETKRGVEDLTIELQNRGFRAVSIHGDKQQSQRRAALDAFKGNRASILIATDVAARGIDIKNVSHVVNFTVPQSFDDYVHRIGRTGRANQRGKAVTFV